MTILNLDKMFSPKSVAFFGANENPGTVGGTVTKNLLKSGFQGPVWLINPHHKTLMGEPCFKSLDETPDVPDLAVIATPPATIPGIIAALGSKGTKACVVITAGIGEDHHLRKKMLEAARPHGIRIMGSNCLGLMIPGIGLNASFAHMHPKTGGLAFLSQSGAVITTVIDWASGRNIGFSHIASLGNMDDVDIGDTLDWLAMDPHCSAIVLYLEQVTNARKFMSAARAVSRIKPVIVLKSGRHEEGAKAAASHTGAMAGSDKVYDAAFLRAGLIRVTELDEMFDAAEILSRHTHIHGNRLAIITNGGGAGVMAVDRLIDYRGQPAVLGQETIQKLDEILPAGWSRANPVDIIGDATPERYNDVIKVIAEDQDVDAILVINCPTALASGEDIAKTLLPTLKSISRNNKTVLAAWLGGDVSEPGRELLEKENIPVYETPEDAIRGFTYMCRYCDIQQGVMRTPPALEENAKSDKERAGVILKEALKSGRHILNELEAKEFMACYSIPVVPTLMAHTPEDVRALISRMKCTTNLVLKILSPDITHKSDFGGVALNIPPSKATDTAFSMLKNIHTGHPEAKLEGFTVQPMVTKQDARELILGIKQDNVFGPVILFGHGGTAAEIVRDTAIELAPLDMNLAKDLMAKTQIYKLMQGYRGNRPVHIDKVADVLTQLSQIAVDFPEIQELDINPLLADADGVLALDARIVVKELGHAVQKEGAHLSIRAYPKQLEKEICLPRGDTVVIRPIIPQDEKYFPLFMEKTSAEDVRQRFFSPLKTLSRSFIAQLTQIDYAREMAFIVLDQRKDEMLGFAHLNADANYERAEYALIVRSDKKSRGLGWALLNYMIEYARSEKIHEIWGTALSDNPVMLKMCAELGFLMKMDRLDPYIINTSLKLDRGTVLDLPKAMHS